jgi:error-prone DNA polymerase
MRFHSPSQLVQDAKRHGVEFTLIDATISGWDSVLERHSDGTPSIVRLGLSLLKVCGAVPPNALKTHAL